MEPTGYTATSSAPRSPSRLIRTGAWDEAAELLSELLERAAAGVNAGLVFHNLAELHAERGDHAAALAAVQSAYDHIETANGSMWLAPVAAARATAELWAGDPDAAVRTIDGCLGLFDHGEYVFFTGRLYELGARAHADLSLLAPDDGEVRDAHLHAGDVNCSTGWTG